ncbi:MAG: EF-P lysine aminoacylase EpmA [Chromatiales bacterium]
MNKDWRPGASMDMLRRRARLIARIRAFFADRLVMEVETPALARAGVTDPHVASLTTQGSLGESGAHTLYLQTSPEYAMKRLLAAGSGPIYQICKVFRAGEAGRLHNPEFTMLEWYRPGFDYQDIMAEVEELLRYTLGVHYCDRLTYAEAFRRHAGFDPLRATLPEIEAAGRRAGVRMGDAGRLERDDWLDLLLSHAVAPHLGAERPVFLCHYPASQAALSRVLTCDPPVAERFEVFVGGVEIANGFHELTDAAEQRLRFESDNARRCDLGLPTMPLDEHLLAALETGLPDCAGVALGVDRLVMVATAAASIDKVQAFDISRA